MNFDQFCDEVLSLIEYEETSLLNWGFTEVEIDLEDQLSTLLGKLSVRLQQAWSEFEDDGNDEADILENLLQRHLLFKVNEAGYRSRFAETIRLLLLLRQRFDYTDWATGARLVSDARIQLQRRRYPRRDIDQQDFLHSLDSLHLTPAQVDTLRLLLQANDGTYYQWAGFQQRATREILERLQKRGQSGVIIGAGTGSGKTKAVYIPALTWLDNRINNQHRVAIIAIYPRNELLKDQFVEAVRETERLNEQRLLQGQRPIMLGAYYGETPRHSRDPFTLSENADWNATFLRCPRCDSTMVWTWVDRSNKIHKLRCQTCSHETRSDHVLITRTQMKHMPPDLLFTTTEMLNRNISQVTQWPIFGIQQSQPPEMLLLDEVHTYEGISGANVAYLLRRWRHACGYDRNNRTLCVVGLSATLSQATETFAKLLGLPSYRVRYITPDEDTEMEEEGIEYNVILKGDPSSGTALLSTSIQAAMLLARTLSPTTDTRDAMTYPPRIFAFVNRLDTLNRWYDNQRDAENEQTLSQYRDWSDLPMREEQRQAIKRVGQDWAVASRIGHNLRESIQVGRTSSQDKGVSDNAKLIIATSALEVGFNDARVGAVMQHQSPITMASFLQRKGRAGRNRRTRPWTVAIMSAYGRDRATFQHAERLFDPLLPPINLPLQNYYVQKIQAAFVLMDWLTQQLQPSFPSLNLWKLLYEGKTKHATTSLISLLKRLLTEQSVRSDYEHYLRKALDLEGKELETTVHNILWGEPRPILIEVVPTILRQLETNWWQLTSADGKTVQAQQTTPPKKPLPEFVPAALFYDLNLPELALYLGNQTEPSPEPFLQTFEEIVPGRVSKRYLPRGQYGSDGYWLSLPESHHEINLTELAIEFVPSQIPVLLQADGEAYRIRRPLAYHLRNVPSNVSSSSNAWPIWRSQFEPRGLAGGEVERHILELADYSMWREFVERLELFSQALSTTVTVTRGMIGVQIAQSRSGERIFGNRYFVEPDPNEREQFNSAGIGYSMDVDGLCIHYRPLDHEKLRQSSNWEMILSMARPQLYLYLLQNDQDLTNRYELNPFEIEWIWQIVTAGLIATAIGGKQSLSQAQSFVEHHFLRVVNRVIEAIFQAASDGDNPTQGRVAEALERHFSNPSIQRSVLQHLHVLWEVNPPQLDNWLELQYASSLGSTFFSALIDLVPDINPMDLSLDIEFEQRRIWITETTPGGIGLIARIAEAIAQYPRRLELQLQDTIHHCEREQRAIALDTVIQSLIRNQNGALAQAFEGIRSQRDFVSVSHAKQHLTAALFSEHLTPTRELVVALNAKILRPNSGEGTDQLTYDLLALWRDEEDRLGVSIELRTLAVAALKQDIIRERLDDILRSWGLTDGISESQRVNLVESMMWTTCKDACEECISHKPRYQQLVKPSRLMLKALLPHQQRIVNYGQVEWKAELIQVLQDHYEAALRCRHDELTQAKFDMMRLLTQQVEVGVQMFYPTLERVEHSGEYWSLHVILREMVGI